MNALFATLREIGWSKSSDTLLYCDVHLSGQERNTFSYCDIIRWVIGLGIY